MKVNKLKIGAGVTTLGLVLALTACGNSSNNDSTINDSAGGNASVGTGTANETNEVTTLSFFSPEHQASSFTDRIANEVTRQTGVAVEVQLPTGSAAERRALMLSTFDYPEIMHFDLGTAELQSYIDNGALIALDEYLVPGGALGDVYEMTKDYLDMMRNPADGKIYYLPSWYGPGETTSTAFIMRYDMMVELVGKERADSPVPFTQDEIIDIFRDFREVYGTNSIALTTTPGSATWTLSGMFGMYEYYHRADGTLGHQTEQPEYLEMVKFMNQLQRENLLDPEWVTLNGDTINQKLLNMDILGYINMWTAVNDVNMILAQEGDDVQYVPYQVLGNGVTQGTFGSTPFQGWNGFAITDNITDLDAALRLLNFTGSREGQNLLWWGIEGEDYTVEAGLLTPTQAIIDTFNADPGNFRFETGIGHWQWLTSNMGPNGITPRELTGAIRIADNQITLADRMGRVNMDGTLWNSSATYGLMPSSGSVGLQASRIRAIMEEALPLMVNAPTEEAMMSAFNQMQSELSAAGIDDVMAAVNEAYAVRREIWGDWAIPSYTR